jgi:hypothetical protein
MDSSIQHADASNAHLANGDGESASTSAAAPAVTYDDLFPSLPASALPANNVTLGEWNRRPPMLASTVVTQVPLPFKRMILKHVLFACETNSAS